MEDYSEYARFLTVLQKGYNRLLVQAYPAGENRVQEGKETFMVLVNRQSGIGVIICLHELA